MDVGCTGTCVPISWVELLEVVRMLDAQVLVCQSVGLKCWKVLRMLDAQVLVCQSVGLKCWKLYGCWMHRY